MHKGRELSSVNGVWLSWRYLPADGQGGLPLAVEASILSIQGWYVDSGLSDVTPCSWASSLRCFEGRQFHLQDQVVKKELSLKIRHRHPYKRWDLVTQRHSVTCHTDLDPQQHRCEHLRIWSCKPFLSDVTK